MFDHPSLYEPGSGRHRHRVDCVGNDAKKTAGLA